MGFNEDDRIRQKNLVHNYAYNEYERLSSLGFTTSDMLDHFEHTIKNPFIRIKILSTIEKIVGRNHDKDNISG